MDKTENVENKSHTSPTHTREQIAKMAGVGTGTVARFNRVTLLKLTFAREVLAILILLN